MSMTARSLRDLRDRFRWVWRQESAWADVACVFALALWTAIDIFTGAGVSERPVYSRLSPAFSDTFISLFTAGLTLAQFAALLTRHTLSRLCTAGLQGTWWMVISLLALTNPVGMVPQLAACSVALWAISWFSVVRVTRRYTISG